MCEKVDARYNVCSDIKIEREREDRVLNLRFQTFIVLEYRRAEGGGQREGREKNRLLSIPRRILNAWPD